MHDAQIYFLHFNTEEIHKNVDINLIVALSKALFKASALNK